MPSDRRWSASPTPDSCSNCGELKAPPHRITSPASTLCVRPRREYSTPMARVPSNSDAVHERPCLDGQVVARHRRVQVRARRAEPPAAVDVAVELGEALLAVAVDVAGERVAGLLHGLEEGAEQRVLGGAALEHERPVVAAVLVATGEAVLHPLEVRQAVGVVPRLHAGVGRPAFVVHRVAALEDHPVDRRRPAEHLAAGVVHAAPVHERLGLALVLPVVEAVADRERERRRHVDEDVPLVVGPPGLEHEHAVGADRPTTGWRAPTRPTHRRRSRSRNAPPSRRATLPPRRGSAYLPADGVGERRCAHSRCLRCVRRVRRSWCAGCADDGPRVAAPASTMPAATDLAPSQVTASTVAPPARCAAMRCRRARVRGVRAR